MILESIDFKITKRWMPPMPPKSPTYDEQRAFRFPTHGTGAVQAFKCTFGEMIEKGKSPVVDPLKGVTPN